MPTMLRNRKTGELMPMNGDLARHDDMMPVDMPDMKRVTYRRGVAYLDEKHVFQGMDDDVPAEPPAPAPKRKSSTKKAAAKAPAQDADAVDLSDIELPDDDD